MPGAGGATRIASTARARRAWWSAQSARVTGSWSLARSSASEVAGRCSAPASRSRRVAMSRRAGQRSRNERRERDRERERKQKDAADAKFAGREQPEAKPRDREEERRNRQRPDERRPSALDKQNAPGQSREPGKSSAAVGAPQASGVFSSRSLAQSLPRLSECTRNASNHGGSVSRAINSSNVLRARTTA